MASTSKGKLFSAMLFKIKVFVFPFLWATTTKLMLFLKKKICSREHLGSNAVHVHEYIIILLPEDFRMNPEASHKSHRVLFSPFFCL